MIYLLYIFLLFISHDIHVSKTEVDFDTKSAALQISTHIYIDDLELDIKNNYGVDSLYIGTEKESEKAEAYLYQYLQDHLLFDINEAPADFEYIGKELSEDLLAVWVYLEIRDVEELRSVTMQYDVLMDVYEDQKNILSLRTPENGKSFFLFHGKKKVESIVF